MTSRQTSERRWLILGVLAVAAIILLTRHSHHLTPASSTPEAQPTVPVPSDPPTPATIAELQARNPTLHWASVDQATVMIVIPQGACGTLTALTPAHISFHTGRDYDRNPHLFSSWADAYTAAERYCQAFAAGNVPTPSPR